MSAIDLHTKPDDGWVTIGCYYDGTRAERWIFESDLGLIAALRVGRRYTDGTRRFIVDRVFVKPTQGAFSICRLREAYNNNVERSDALYECPATATLGLSGQSVVTCKTVLHGKPVDVTVSDYGADNGRFVLERSWWVTVRNEEPQSKGRIFGSIVWADTESVVRSAYQENQQYTLLDVHQASAEELERMWDERQA